jgi:hypothetical protein
MVSSNSGFEVFGRVIYKPALTGSSADIYLYYDGEPDLSGVIQVDTVSIPLVDSARGFYRSDLVIEIGDTLDYSISSLNGEMTGQVIIPDTVNILSPQNFDTFQIPCEIDMIWLRELTADGYFVYIEDQSRLFADIGRTHFDTVSIFVADDLIVPGEARVWVESLRGEFIDATTPSGYIIPKGMVGAAGAFRIVYITF